MSYLELEVAASRLLAVLENNGEWEDARCFYYNKTAAPELEMPMRNLREALKATE
jgi:hypothetical protein